MCADRWMGFETTRSCNARQPLSMGAAGCMGGGLRAGKVVRKGVVDVGTLGALPREGARQGFGELVMGACLPLGVHVEFHRHSGQVLTLEE